MHRRPDLNLRVAYAFLLNNHRRRAMAPKTSRDLAGPPPRKDEERETTEAVIEDADKSDGVDRDREHGDGGTLGLPTGRKPKA
jgi:hypothetical protein